MNVIGIAFACIVLWGGLWALGKSDSNLSRFVQDRISGGNADGPIKDKCIIKLIQETYFQLGLTYMFITDDHRHEALLHNLQLNFVHSYFTEPSFLTPSGSDSFYHLLIFRRKFKLNEVIKAKAPPQNTKIFILVRNYQEVVEKFRVLWRYRLVHAVAAFVDAGNAYYYTYFPYWRTHCGRVGTPHLLAKCDIGTGLFSHKENLFPSKVNNLYKCPINVTFKENVPSSYRSEKNKLVGWEVDLVRELLARMNGVPNYKMLRAKPVYRKREGYQELVVSLSNLAFRKIANRTNNRQKHAEIGGGLALTLSSLSKTDFCIYGMSLCILWIVPDWKGNAYSFNFLIKVFPVRVWALLFFTYILMILVIRFFLKAKYKDIAFKLLPFLLGTTTRVKKMSKRLGALWLLFCLIVNAIYQSGYQSRLLVPLTPPKRIRTSDIAKSNLKILGFSDVITDMRPYLKRRYNISESRFSNGEIFSNGKSFSYKNWIYRMAVKKDSAYFGFKETVRYLVDKTDLAREIHIPQTCEIKYLLTLVLKKNSHLTEKLTGLSNRLNENGFLDFYVTKHLSKQSPRNIPSKLTAILKPKHGFGNSALPPSINMDRMSIVFMCLVMGISLGFIAFVMEITYNWCCRKIKNKCKSESPFPWKYID